MERDQTEQIERLDAFETKFGIHFTGLYAALTGDDEERPINFVVRGEVHAKAKNFKIKESLDIVLVAYDAKGRVIGKSDHYLSEDSFFGFEVFEIQLYDLPSTPAQIKLYPKAS